MPNLACQPRPTSVHLDAAAPLCGAFACPPRLLEVDEHLLANRWLLAADGQQPIAMLPGERSALRKGALRQ
jgi:hypothetical protein